MSVLCEKYKLKITNDRFVLIKPLDYGDIAKDDSNFKIYIFIRRTKVLYVGLTSQRVSTRLSGSFRSFKNWSKSNKSTNGYSGYKMLRELLNKGSIKLMVFPLKHLKKTKSKKYDEYAKAIEAEIVYLIRKKTNKWPVFQNEIHFYNLRDSEKYAKKIFNKLAINSKAHARN